MDAVKRYLKTVASALPEEQRDDIIRELSEDIHSEIVEKENAAGRFLSEAEQHGHDLLLDIDVQGAEQIKKKIPEAVSVFILPPDRKTLEQRLRKRGQDAEDVIQRRLDTARREIENYVKYDYILVNDRLEDSIELLQAILLAERLRRSGKAFSGDQPKIFAQAERCRLENVRDRVQPILDSFREGDSGRAKGL